MTPWIGLTLLIGKSDCSKWNIWTNYWGQSPILPSRSNIWFLESACNGSGQVDPTLGMMLTTKWSRLTRLIGKSDCSKWNIWTNYWGQSVILPSRSNIWFLESACNGSKWIQHWVRCPQQSGFDWHDFYVLEWLFKANKTEKVDSVSKCRVFSWKSFFCQAVFKYHHHQKYFSNIVSYSWKV